MRTNKIIKKLKDKIAKFLEGPTGDLDLATYQRLESKKYRKSRGNYYV